MSFLRKGFTLILNGVKRYGLKASILLFGGSFILLSIYVLAYSYMVFSIINQGKTMFSTGIYESSSIFGIKGKSNSSGFISFPGGDSIPVELNSKGERVGTQTKDENNFNSIILFIGDSFTFGDANYFEESFPYLISQGLKMKLLNASMVGYGYAQYLLKIQEEMNEGEFNTIAIQLSPHSVERAVNGSLPAFSKIPTPFFCIDGQDTIIHPPLYKTNLFEVINRVGISQFSDKGFSFKLYWNFLINIGVPIYVNQIVNEISSLIKKKNYKRVLTEQEAELVFFSSLNNFFESQKYNVVFYNVGYSPDDFDEKVKELKTILHFKATFVNFERPLWKLVGDLDEYYKRFCHWRGNPSILVDKHYNKEAHAIVAGKFIQDFLSEQQNDIDN